jgi:hypothetical protein
MKRYVTELPIAGNGKGVNQGREKSTTENNDEGVFMIFDLLTGEEGTTTSAFTDSVISQKDRTVLRTLAARMVELASRPVEKEKMALWYAHNDLTQVRPLVFCDPEGGWNEIIPENALCCEGDLARRWERFLRKQIFWGESLKDDKVIEPFFSIPYMAVESNWGLQETKVGGENKGVYIWQSPLKDFRDIDKLHFPQIIVNRDKTEALFEQAEEVFKDILKVRRKNIWWWSHGLTLTLSKLRGLEQILLDMIDNPDGLHQLMALIRDGTLAEIDFLENNGLLNLNNDNTYVGSGGFGWTRQLPQKEFDGIHVHTKDIWGFADSQETSGVSPKMFNEFVFQYQLPILERFGLNCYGCCEALDTRWEIINKTPNLRRVSVSPWANVGDMAEKLQDKYIFSLKPHPGYLAVSSIDEDLIRKSLREALRLTRANNCHVEIIMKDIHTLANNPKNAIRWCQIAMEEVLSA